MKIILRASVLSLMVLSTLLPAQARAEPYDPELEDELGTSTSFDVGPGERLGSPSRAPDHRYGREPNIARSGHYEHEKEESYSYSYEEDFAPQPPRAAPAPQRATSHRPAARCTVGKGRPSSCHSRPRPTCAPHAVASCSSCGAPAYEDREDSTFVPLCEARPRCGSCDHERTPSRCELPPRRGCQANLCERSSCGLVRARQASCDAEPSCFKPGHEDKRFYFDVYGGAGIRRMDAGGKNLTGDVYGAQFGVTQRRVWSLGLALEHSSFSVGGSPAAAYAPAFQEDVTLAKVVLQLVPSGSDFSLELGLGAPLQRRLQTKNSDGSPASLAPTGEAWEASLDLGYSWYFRRAPFFLRPSVELSRGRLWDDTGVPGAGTCYNQATALLRAGYIFH